MNEDLKKDVEVLVTEIFSQKEEAEQRSETEKALQKSADTIQALTEALEGKNVEGEEVAKNDAQEKAEKLAESEKMIEDMKKDKAAELRMAELTEEGVALSNKEAQMAKVREMEDEEFASYKEELVSLRSAVKAELAKATPEVDTASEEETQEEEVAEVVAEVEEGEVAAEELEEGEEEASEEVAPANIDPGHTVAAAMNMEVMPSDNILAKYAKLGKAMADRMKNDN